MTAAYRPPVDRSVGTMGAVLTDVDTVITRRYPTRDQGLLRFRLARAAEHVLMNDPTLEPIAVVDRAELDQEAIR